MDGLLRKKDLVEAVGVAKSTIADWITEFHIFIPMVKHGAVTYYKPEALDVLKAIRELRELDQSKVQIMELLYKKGFPVTVEEAERFLSGADPRDTLLTVMQTMGQAVVEIGRQTERQNRIETRIEEHYGRISETVDQVADLRQAVEEMKRQLATTQAEASAAKERAERAEAESSKPWWRRWK